jgi:hypothetical protein
MGKTNPESSGVSDAPEAAPFPQGAAADGTIVPQAGDAQQADMQPFLLTALPGQYLVTPKTPAELIEQMNQEEQALGRLFTNITTRLESLKREEALLQKAKAEIDAVQPRVCFTFFFYFFVFSPSIFLESAFCYMSIVYCSCMGILFLATNSLHAGSKAEAGLF